MKNRCLIVIREMQCSLHDSISKELKTFMTNVRSNMRRAAGCRNLPVHFNAVNDSRKEKAVVILGRVAIVN